MADEKLTAQTELTAPEAEDIIYIVDDPGGTPASKKISKHNFEKPHITSETSSANPTINVDVADEHRITALATNIASFTTNLSGTPYHGQRLIVEILDDGTGRTIAWGASFASTDVGVLPTATTANKKIWVGLRYDSVDGVWYCLAVGNKP